MEYKIIEYPNGIKAILGRVKSPVVHCALTIGTGAADEETDQHGTAHFIEHMLFKGTKKRKQYHINSLLDNVGGELNAYTTKEETVVHSTALKSDFTKSIDLICDIVFNSVYDKKEMDKERAVVIDEINSYKDSPAEQIFDDFEDMIFEGTPYGHPILGNKKSLKSINKEKIQSFISRCYNTDKIIFSTIGNITPERFQKICDSYFSDIPSNIRTWQREELSNYLPKIVEIDKRGYQSHIMMGRRAYSYYDDKKVQLALLTNLLGGNSPSSILNQELREKRGLTYSTEASYTSFEKSGIFSIYVGCDKENRDKCQELINSITKKLSEEKLSDYNLSRYKRQLIGQIAISSDNNESLMLSSARSLLIYNNIDNFERIANKINSITPTDICSVAEEIFNSEYISKLIYK